MTTCQESGLLAKYRMGTVTTREDDVRFGWCAMLVVDGRHASFHYDPRGTANGFHSMLLVTGSLDAIVDCPRSTSNPKR